MFGDKRRVAFTLREGRRMLDGVGQGPCSVVGQILLENSLYVEHFHFARYLLRRSIGSGPHSSPDLGKERRLPFSPVSGW